MYVTYVTYVRIRDGGNQELGRIKVDPTTVGRLSRAGVTCSALRNAESFVSLGLVLLVSDLRNAYAVDSKKYLFKGIIRQINSRNVCYSRWSNVS